ncbi:MAG: ribulose 1,5-bisphosphate carboxylase large subunit [Proteobacteria bacterium]|nr:ribulose 1,5-bisphosphate carboxylase large subunit [Pseudomonadota bacterium]
MYNPLCDVEPLRRPEDENSLKLTYHYFGEEPEEFARDIAVEQSIEFPVKYVRAREIMSEIVPRVQSIRPIASGYEIRLSFNPEVARPDFVQFLNVLFGNISMKFDVKLVDIEFPSCMFVDRGPRFGVEGIRALTHAEACAPVLASALKPMGLTARAFAQIASSFVERGMHLIKDDHGLADQSFAPFEARVRAVSEAVAEANAKYGRHTLYAPNISGPVETLMARAHFAKEAGAGALMVAPGLMGFDAIRALRQDATLSLPILAHPSFLGMCALDPRQGLSYGIAFGTLNRYAGADVVIFPNHGGRFAFTLQDCREIFEASLAPCVGMKRALPAPAGGMKVGNIPEIADTYQTQEFVALIGGDMYRPWAE